MSAGGRGVAIGGGGGRRSGHRPGSADRAEPDGAARRDRRHAEFGAGRRSGGSDRRAQRSNGTVCGSGARVDRRRVGTSCSRRLHAALPRAVLRRASIPRAGSLRPRRARSTVLGDSQVVPPDLSFFDELSQRSRCVGRLRTGLRHRAHEVGHRVQNQLGIAERVRRRAAADPRARPTQIQWKMELQADCFAGVWGFHAQQAKLIEPGDFERRPDRPPPRSATTGCRSRHRVTSCPNPSRMAPPAARQMAAPRSPER